MYAHHQCPLRWMGGGTGSDRSSPGTELVMSVLGTVQRCASFKKKQVTHTVGCGSLSWTPPLYPEAFASVWLLIPNLELLPFISQMKCFVLPGPPQGRPLPLPLWTQTEKITQSSGHSQSPVICFANLCTHWIKMFVFHVPLSASKGKWLKKNFKGIFFRSSPPTQLFSAASLPAF